MTYNSEFKLVGRQYCLHESNVFTYKKKDEYVHKLYHTLLEKFRIKYGRGSKAIWYVG